MKRIIALILLTVSAGAFVAIYVWLTVNFLKMSNFNEDVFLYFFAYALIGMFMFVMYQLFKISIEDEKDCN